MCGPPGFSFLEPWAEICERLRRIFKLNQYPRVTCLIKRPVGFAGLLYRAEAASRRASYSRGAFGRAWARIVTEEQAGEAWELSRSAVSAVFLLGQLVSLVSSGSV